MALTKIQSLGITDGTIVNADINASAAIAGTKLTGVNDAKAWVSFNGTGTPAIRGSFNVSSITDNNVGDYTVNFTTVMPDANYAMCGSIRNTQTYAQIQAGAPTIAQSTAPTTSAIRINTPVVGDSSVRANIDSDYVSVSIFR